MSTAIAGNGRRGIIGMMAAILAMGMQSTHSLRLEAPSAEKIVPKPRYVRLPSMSPVQYFRARAKAGRPMRHKNKAKCARNAKIARRRAA
jgi:hypothetical protein